MPPGSIGRSGERIAKPKPVKPASARHVRFAHLAFACFRSDYPEAIGGRGNADND